MPNITTNIVPSIDDFLELPEDHESVFDPDKCKYRLKESEILRIQQTYYSLVQLKKLFLIEVNADDLQVALEDFNKDFLEQKLLDENYATTQWDKKLYHLFKLDGIYPGIVGLIKHYQHQFDVTLDSNTYNAIHHALLPMYFGSTPNWQHELFLLEQCASSFVNFCRKYLLSDYFKARQEFLDTYKAEQVTA